MKRKVWLLALVGLIMVSGVSMAIAPMSVGRWVMSGGEAPRSSGPLAINATIGQPAIGHSSSGPLALSWGYWGGGTSAQQKRYLPLVSR